MRPYASDGLVRLWLAKPEPPPRAVWANRLELGVVIAINAVLWLMIITAIVMTVRQLVT